MSDEPEQGALPELPSYAVFDLGSQMSVDAVRLRAEQAQRERNADLQRAELILSRQKIGLLPDGTHEDWFKPEYYVRYDLATGDLMATGTMSRAAIEEEDRLFEGDGYVIVDQQYHPDTYWFDVATMWPKPREACWARIENRDGHPYWLVNLPVPCTITITDEAFDQTTVSCTTEEVEFEFDAPGTYEVLVQSVRCFDGTYTFAVAEAHVHPEVPA